MTDVAAPSIAQPGDRRAGLVLFGLIQILVGVICAGFTLLIAAGAEVQKSGAALASPLVVWGLATVYFFAAGIGSIRGRRWARALSVVVSAIWTVAGIVVTLMLMIMPRVFGGGVAIVALVIGGVLLPVGLFVFYQSPHTRAACERLDPNPRWTDRVPLPVLAVVVVMAFGSVALLANLANPVLPLFGRTITGAPAAMAVLAFSILSAFLAVQLYRLKESAWWTVMLLQAIGVVYGATVLITTDNDPMFLAVLLATWVGYFAFLIYLRRYFTGRLVPRTRRDDGRQASS